MKKLLVKYNKNRKKKQFNNISVEADRVLVELNHTSSTNMALMLQSHAFKVDMSPCAMSSLNFATTSFYSKDCKTLNYIPVCDAIWHSFSSNASL